MDDLPLLAVLVSEALVRLGIAERATHGDVVAALGDVLRENRTRVRLEQDRPAELDELELAAPGGRGR